MGKKIQVRDQESERALGQQKTESGVSEGRRELAHLIGRLLARRWLKQQYAPVSSARSTGTDDDGESL
jgi:hypothetical protein